MKLSIVLEKPTIISLHFTKLVQIEVTIYRENGEKLSSETSNKQCSSVRSFAERQREQHFACYHSLEISRINNYIVHAAAVYTLFRFDGE